MENPIQGWNIIIQHHHNIFHFLWKEVLLHGIILKGHYSNYELSIDIRLGQYKMYQSFYIFLREKDGWSRCLSNTVLYLKKLLAKNQTQNLSILTMSAEMASSTDPSWIRAIFLSLLEGKLRYISDNCIIYFTFHTIPFFDFYFN